jgi:hypothetical protein
MTKKFLENSKIKVKIKNGEGTWMCFFRGAGELENVCQGRSRDSCFAQETVANIQYQPRIGEVPMLLDKVQDALVSDSSSLFSFLFRAGAHLFLNPQKPTALDGRRRVFGLRHCVPQPGYASSVSTRPSCLK